LEHGRWVIKIAGAPPANTLPEHVGAPGDVPGRVLHGTELVGAS